METNRRKVGGRLKIRQKDGVEGVVERWGRTMADIEEMLIDSGGGISSETVDRQVRLQEDGEDDYYCIVMFLFLILKTMDAYGL